MTAASARDSHERLAGLFVPIVTPFAADGAVALDHFESNLRKWLDEPIDGFVLFGSNGEGALLDTSEKEQLTARAQHVIAHEKPVVVGISAESTRAGRAEAERLGALGADYLLVSPPAYFGASLSPAALLDHYHGIADAAPVPLIVYHIPKNTHVVIEPGLMAEIVRHPNVAGFKDSSGDIRRFGEYAVQCGTRCRRLIGNGSQLYAALELGAAGAIIGIGQFAARPCAEIIEAQRAGDHARAGRIQERLIPVHKEIVGAHGPIGTKAALDLIGYTGGPPRPPLRPLSAKEQQRVARVMHEAALT
ncbi:MAG TPA: dihydrodipicolinate synthase family protein [Longimicrobiales bacterium]